MPPKNSPHVIETRQKTDLLFSVIASVSSGAKNLLAAAGVFTSPVRLVAGYGAINFLIISNAAFTLRVKEANDPAGPWAQTELQASAADAAGNQFICLQVAPCGAYMQIFVDNGAAPQTAFALAGIGLPVAGGGGGSSSGGGGTGGIVQLRDGSAATTLASVKVDATAIGTQGSVLVGGEAPGGLQQAIRVNAAGQLIVAPTPNRTSFEDNQKTVAVPGTAVQLQAQAIPDGFTVFVAALDDNTGNIYFGNSAADAQTHTKANVLTAGAFRTLALQNVNAIWIDADVAGEGVQWLVEI